MLLLSVIAFSSCDSNKNPPACAHNWADATCTEKKTCTLCKATEGEALGHTWVDADCVTPKTCSVCTTTEGEALGHTWVDANCVTPKTCSVCTTTEGEALGHTWVDADCVTPKTCSVCATTEGEALGHTWVDADCVTPKTCSVCATTEGEALGHTWVDADCITPKTCSECDETEGRALGHDWVDADCLNPKTCSECDETEGEALGHNWVDADCLNPKTCSECDETEGEALGHDWVEYIETEASCTSSGTKSFKCDNCNDSYTEEYSLPSYSATEIHDMTEKSVGEILTYDKSGSGLALGTCFAYSADGKIITNYHVIDGAYSAEISIAGKTYPVKKVLAYDKDIDVAILKIDAELSPVKLCASEHKIGATVYAFGSSKGLTATFSQGIITSNRELDGVVYVQHDAAISSGNSGGPLINEYGEVIAINTMTVKDSQNLNFAINVSELDNLKYNEQLTMSEFFEKECDVYTKLKNYIVKKGVYDDSSNCYRFKFAQSKSSDGKYQYTSYITYYVANDNISFRFDIDDTTKYSSWSMVNFYLDGNIDGVYRWYYTNSEDYEMNGLLYANTYTDDTLLGYSNNNIYSSSLRSTIRNLASTMMDFLISNIDRYLSDSGVSSSDLGFTKF